MSHTSAALLLGPISIYASAPVALNWKSGPSATLFLLDRIDGGRGRIVGTVKEKADPINLPLSRKVRLFREFDGRFIRETFSDAAGNYSFIGIDPTIRYTVIAYDYAQNYRAVIADNLLPEVV